MSENTTALANEVLCKNLSSYLKHKLGFRPTVSEIGDSNSNAFMYIIFVLMFYALSLLVLLIKYMRKERESLRLEYYYQEFVKREKFRRLPLYDSTGRLLHFIPHNPKDDNEDNVVEN